MMHKYGDLRKEMLLIDVITFFYKYVLGVGKRVSTNAAIAECGRHGIYVDYYLKCVKYWCTLVNC